jgi:hypothetical protein
MYQTFIVEHSRIIFESYSSTVVMVLMVDEQKFTITLWCCGLLAHGLSSASSEHQNRGITAAEAHNAQQRARDRILIGVALLSSLSAYTNSFIEAD